MAHSEKHVETFGQRLARLRRARGLTQGELAEKIGVSRRTVTYYESESDRPLSYVLDLLTQVLGFSADEILGIRPVAAEAPVNLRIWRRFRIIEDLSASDRMAVWKFVQALTHKSNPKRTGESPRGLQRRPR